MTKIHIVDTVEATSDSYDAEDFCKLWNKGEIVDTHRNHYQYKIYSDINKARSLLKYCSNEMQELEKIEVELEESLKRERYEKQKQMYLLLLKQ